MTHTAIATDSEVVPPGEGYLGTLKSVTDGTSKFGPVYDWTFTVDGPDGPVEVSRRTSQKFSPTTIARQFASALMGRSIQKGEVVDLDALIGREVSLAIETNPNGLSSVADIAPASSGQVVETVVAFKLPTGVAVEPCILAGFDVDRATGYLSASNIYVRCFLPTLQRLPLIFR